MKIVKMEKSGEVAMSPDMLMPDILPQVVNDPKAAMEEFSTMFGGMRTNAFGIPPGKGTPKGKNKKGVGDIKKVNNGEEKHMSLVNAAVEKIVKTRNAVQRYVGVPVYQQRIRIGTVTGLNTETGMLTVLGEEDGEKEIHLDRVVLPSGRFPKPLTPIEAIRLAREGGAVDNGIIIIGGKQLSGYTRKEMLKITPNVWWER